VSIRVAALIFVTVLLISNIGDIPNISHSKANKDVPFERQGRVERESGREDMPFLASFSLSLCPAPFPFNTGVPHSASVKRFH